MSGRAGKTGTALTVAAGVVAIPWLVVTVMEFADSTLDLRLWSTLLGAVCMALLWVGLFIRWRASQAGDR